MKYVYLVMLTCLSTGAFAKGHCMFKGQKVDVGESIWVQEPGYAQMMKEHLKAQGYSDDKIAQEVESSDRAKRQLVCEKVTTASNAAESYALVKRENG